MPVMLRLKKRHKMDLSAVASKTKHLIRRHIIYRCVILLILLAFVFDDIARIWLMAFFLFCLAGLVVRFVENKGIRSSSEQGLYLYYCSALHFVEFLWNGFEKGTFVDD